MCSDRLASSIRAAQTWRPSLHGALVSCSAQHPFPSAASPSPFCRPSPHNLHHFPLIVTTASYWIMYPSLHRALRCWQKYVNITRCVSGVLNILTWLPEARPAPAVRATTLYLLLGGGETQGNEFRKDSDPPPPSRVSYFCYNPVFNFLAQQSSVNTSWQDRKEKLNLLFRPFPKTLEIYQVSPMSFDHFWDVPTSWFIYSLTCSIHWLDSHSKGKTREREYRGITVNCLACRVEPGTCCSRHIHPNGISSGHQSCAYIP